jgi:hypothetical protein
MARFGPHRWACGRPIPCRFKYKDRRRRGQEKVRVTSMSRQNPDRRASDGLEFGRRGKTGSGLAGAPAARRVHPLDVFRLLPGLPDYPGWLISTSLFADGMKTLPSPSWTAVDVNFDALSRPHFDLHPWYLHFNLVGLFVGRPRLAGSILSANRIGSTVFIVARCLRCIGLSPPIASTESQPCHDKQRTQKPHRPTPLLLLFTAIKAPTATGCVGRPSREQTSCQAPSCHWAGRTA